MNLHKKRGLSFFCVFGVLAFAYSFLLVSTPITPASSQIASDIARILQPVQTESIKVEVSNVVVLDGWSDGIELKMNFALQIENESKIHDKRFAPPYTKTGDTLTNGVAATSYVLEQNGSWRLIHVSIDSYPILKK